MWSGLILRQIVSKDKAGWNNKVFWVFPLILKAAPPYCIFNIHILLVIKLFYKMPCRNLVSWNTMISGYLHNDKFEEACLLFNKMSERNHFTWTLTCYTRSGNIEKARELFDLLPDKRNAACWNALISGYFKNGRLRDARNLFHEMSVKDLISWNAMLAGYTQNGEMLTDSSFEEMLEKDVVPWNLIVDGFVEIGDLVSAWYFFDRIPNPNVVSWVNGYVKSW